ncbi:hypothetical protein EBU94_03160 [bacterium]|nr:hypothetical protein [bacterium]
MKYLRKFESYIKEDMSEPTIAPTRPKTRPMGPPTKPQKPVKPFKPVVRPSVDPEIKDVTELDVAYRFIDELNKRGESVSDYLND